MTTTQPTAPASGMVTIARFDSYAGAQHLVDRLSDERFPVETVRIVGNGIRSVEDVTGRLTKGRAALYGAGMGAWWGVLVTTVLIGAVFGAVAGFLGHLATGGRRDFSSVTGLQAAEYEVQVDAGRYDEAVRLLSRPTAA